MAESLIRIAHSELVAYAGMILILTAFVLETRGILHSKERLYLLHGIRLRSSCCQGVFDRQWAFLILEVARFLVVLCIWSIVAKVERL